MVKYDLVLYGATGFTGRLVARYLDTVPDLQGKSWAIAGRTASKLQALKATLERPADVLTVELTDAAATEQLVRSTRAVINCAGPFSQNCGEELLGECARSGVHYSDLAGEGWWQSEMANKFHSVAQKSGAKIVLGGGVDSIPSDLGTMLALGALPPDADGAEATVKVLGVYTEYSGSFSGGTLNSGRAKNKAMRDGVLTEAMEANPYLICKDGTTGPDTTVDGMPSGFGWGLRWLQPFFMGAINARVVRRSLALKELEQHVSYAECSSLGLWLRIGWVYLASGLGYFRGAPINLKPRSGEGPPPWLVREGAFTMEVTATAASGTVATAVVRGQGDPGYGATAKMLAETGLCLSFDAQPAHSGGGGGGGGVLTPWTGLGELLVSRLRRAEGGNFMSLVVRSDS
jgi:short subunit dehydrogenase-like uncharacterized protein